jgi:hypothetical protein
MLPLLLLAMALCVVARGDEGDPNPGTAVPASLTATLKLPEVAVIGDHIRGEFIVKNTGRQPVKIRAGEGSALLHARHSGGSAPPNLGFGEAVVDPWLQVHVWNERAKVLADMVEGPLYVPEKKVPTVTLAPGESKSVYCPLERYVAIVKPDIYTVSVWNDLGWQVDPNHPPLMATANIVFMPPNAQSIAARVRTLCAKETEENLWELMHLWSPLFLPALRDEARAGHAQACLGMTSMISDEVNPVLLSFASSKDFAVARAAMYALSTRLPSATDPGKPALLSWNGKSTRDAILRMWQPKFDAPLTSAATRFLESAPIPTKAARKVSAGSSDPMSQLVPSSVALAARIVEARGSVEQAPALLTAIQRALEANVEPRKGPEGVFVPAPLDVLMQTVDSLRGRGWRTDGKGGTGATLAWQRQLADPRIPKPTTEAWQETVRTTLSSKSPILRENALRAIPVPVPDDWEPLLRSALEDEDAGVQYAACRVTGNSGRVNLRSQLIQIVLNGRDPQVQLAAAESATQLGGSVDLWFALCEVMPQPAMTANALTDLVRGTLDVPQWGVVVDNNLTREQAVAVRDAWKGFLDRNRGILESGRRVPRNDPSITPTMMLAVRALAPN